MIKQDSWLLGVLGVVTVIAVCLATDAARKEKLAADFEMVFGRRINADPSPEEIEALQPVVEREIGELQRIVAEEKAMGAERLVKPVQDLLDRGLEVAGTVGFKVPEEKLKAHSSRSR